MIDPDQVEVDLVMETGLSPPPSLGIRVIGVNMIHGVPDKLNIYVKVSITYMFMFINNNNNDINKIII